MEKLKGAFIIGQSGGPTSVINASVQGCIEAALKSDCITRVFGASHGIRGILDDRLYDMRLEDPEEIKRMQYTPSAIFGSCRYKLADPLTDETDYQRLLDVFKKYDVRYFFYNGGNDSMDTCSKISAYLAQKGYECRVMGIPKTIDNDLDLTDHCPGYGSAAKYVATTCMEVGLDAKAYGEGSITVVEIMGRNAGWLTAASAVAKLYGSGPDLIYLPEIPFDLADFIADVKRIYDKQKDVMVAVSEGIMDKNGTYISSYFSETAKDKDAFGHAQMGGLAASLSNFANANFTSAKIKAKVRGIEFSLLQRCASHSASKTDIEEAYLAGKTAFEAAESGISDMMVAFKRVPGPVYKCETELVDLVDVANAEKKVPREWINAAGNGMLEPFFEYVLPLIQGESELEMVDGVPRFAKLKRIMTREM
ncbi:pyrophosphate--fructose 6-phosphate 1-phosphotransferase [Clostridia bacterium]|nr:pyrophosphate--fructose 6-phosphate 1-phosphotransferase [Clostridia bacterium]